MADILTIPISELELSKKFVEDSKRMNYKTLEMILKNTPKEMMSKDGFNQIWFAELCDFLQVNGLHHLLQSPYGDSRV